MDRNENIILKFRLRFFLKIWLKIEEFTLNVFADVEPVDQGGSGCRRIESGQHGHGGGFSGSVVPQKGRYLALVHVQVNVVNGQFTFSVLFGQAFDLNPSAETNGLLFDEFLILDGSLGSRQSDVLRQCRTAAPVVLL